MTTRSVVIVGAGLAGARCAETLRAEGFDGDLVLVGEESVAPYERPALSKEFLAGAKSVADLLLRPQSFWAEQRIELVLGQRVGSVDRTRRTVTTSSGLELGWDTLVLATGARPRHLPFASPAGVHVLRTLADAEALRDELLPGARLAIVGGGFVGAEVASTARSRGVDVTLLEAGSAPFERALGAELGARLADRYRDHGVDIHTETAAAGFRETSAGRVDAVILRDGTVIESDVVLVAVGVEPAHELGRTDGAPGLCVRRQRRQPRPLDRRRGGSGRDRQAPARARSAPAAAAVLLVRSVRPQVAARRRHHTCGRDRGRGLAGLVRRALPGVRREARRRPRLESARGRREAAHGGGGSRLTRVMLSGWPRSSAPSS